MLNKSKKISVYLLALILTSIAIITAVSAYNGYYWDDFSSEEATWFFGMSFAICMLFVVIWFIIFIAIAIWVYKDAERRGSSGALWLIIVILLGIIGIIIWLIVRPPIGGHPKQPGPGTGRMCPGCGRPIPMDAQICPYCGKRFQQ